MIRNYAIKTALLLTMVSPAPATLRAQAGGSEDAAAAIRSLEQQWTVGQSRNNNAALDLIFDNALVYVEYGKLVPKGEYLARIKHEEPAATQIELQPTSVHIFGHTAVATGIYVEKEEGPRHALKRWRFIDTWVFKKNSWVLVAAGASPIKE